MKKKIMTNERKTRKGLDKMNQGAILYLNVKAVPKAENHERKVK